MFDLDLSTLKSWDSTDYASCFLFLSVLGIIFCLVFQAFFPTEGDTHDTDEDE